jgi:hypothetical protein
MIAKLEWMLAGEKPVECGGKNPFLYEMVLKTTDGGSFLEVPENARRVVRALSAIQEELGVEWLDILMWKGGLYLRLKPGRAASLLEILAMLREESTPLDAGTAPPWEDEPTWVKMAAPGPSRDFQRITQEKPDFLRAFMGEAGGLAPVLFAYPPGSCAPWK